MATNSIQFHVKVPFDVEREGDLFVSSCPPLDVYSQGKTEEEAIANLAEAISLFIETCQNMGTLDDVLRDCGFVPNSCESQSDENMLDVPLPLLVARKHAQANTH